MKKPNRRIVSLSRKDSRQEGFTLLEVMISITLLVILISVIGGTLRLIYRSINSGERKIEGTERFRNTVAFMSAQIQSAIPLTEGEGAEKKFIFAGEKTTLRFVTTTSLWGNQKGPVLVTYNLVQRDDGPQNLCISEQVIGLKSNKEAVLLTAANDFAFEYYYKKPPTEDGTVSEEGTWTDRWKEPDTLPEKVRIHIGTGTKQWSFVFPVRISATLEKGETVYNTTTIP